MGEGSVLNVAKRARVSQGAHVRQAQRVGSSGERALRSAYSSGSVTPAHGLSQKANGRRVPKARLPNNASQPSGKEMKYVTETQAWPGPQCALSSTSFTAFTFRGRRMGSLARGRLLSLLRPPSSLPHAAKGGNFPVQQISSRWTESSPHEDRSPGGKKKNNSQKAKQPPPPTTSINKSEPRASSSAWGRVHQPCDGSEARANQMRPPPRRLSLGLPEAQPCPEIP